MTAAYEQALFRLKLKDKKDPITELLARLIIQVAKRGVQDATEICSITLNELQYDGTKLPNSAFECREMATEILTEAQATKEPARRKTLIDTAEQYVNRARLLDRLKRG
jgi:hypothetical protein